MVKKLGNTPSRTEIAQLRASLDNERANAEDLRQNCTRMAAEIERMRADNNRLKELFALTWDATQSTETEYAYRQGFEDCQAGRTDRYARLHEQTTERAPLIAPPTETMIAAGAKVLAEFGLITYGEAAIACWSAMRHAQDYPDKQSAEDK